MANRTFDRDLFTIQKRLISLWAVVGVPSGTTPVLQRWQYGSLGSSSSYTPAATTGGGTGFPTRYSQGAEGVFKVTRTAPGLWTVELQDSYRRLLGLHADMAIAGGTANIVQCAENTTISNINAAPGSIIGVALLSSTGTPADPTAGASTLIRIRLDLQDATEP